MTMREQFERVLRVTLLVFVLAAAGFISAVAAIRIAIRGRIVVMPNLVGQPGTAAQRVLAAKGLQLRVADRIFSFLPANDVARQTPAPGDQVKVSQNVHVVLSLGPQTVRVPPLEGFSMRAGRIALLQAGLQLGKFPPLTCPERRPIQCLSRPRPRAAPRRDRESMCSSPKATTRFITSCLRSLGSTSPRPRESSHQPGSGSHPSPALHKQAHQRASSSERPRRAELGSPATRQLSWVSPTRRRVTFRIYASSTPRQVIRPASRPKRNPSKPSKPLKERRVNLAL